MKKIIYMLACLLLMIAVPSQAKDKHRGEGHDERSSEDSRHERDDRDRGEHRGEYESRRGRDGGKHHKAPPPGWRKKLNRGERVDDTIYVFLAPPPREVIAVLPPPPPGVSFRQIEDKIVRINDINRQILEVLDLDKLPIPKPPRLPLPPLPKF